MARADRHVQKQKAIKRLKNPFFWIGIGGVILTSLQVEASTLTSWASVGDLIVRTASNPYLLCTTGMAVLGVLIDPTTKGIKDVKKGE